MHAAIQNLRRSWRQSLCFLLSVAALIAMPGLVLAQLDEGAITGTVTALQTAASFFTPCGSPNFAFDGVANTGPKKM